MGSGKRGKRARRKEDPNNILRLDYVKHLQPILNKAGPCGLTALQIAECLNWETSSRNYSRVTTALRARSQSHTADCHITDWLPAMPRSSDTRHTDNYYSGRYDAVWVSAPGEDAPDPQTHPDNRFRTGRRKTWTDDTLVVRKNATGEPAPTVALPYADSILLNLGRKVPHHADDTEADCS